MTFSADKEFGELLRKFFKKAFGSIAVCLSTIFSCQYLLYMISPAIYRTLDPSTGYKTHWIS